jgi:hypothetical protein
MEEGAAGASAGAASSSPSAAASTAQAVLVGLDGCPRQPAVRRPDLNYLEAEHGKPPVFQLVSGRLVVKREGTDLESFARFFDYSFFKRSDLSTPVPWSFFPTPRTT